MAHRQYAPALAGKPSSVKLVKHKLDHLDENNEEYEASTFGGFSDYMRRKKIKLQNQDALMRARAPADTPAIFAGMVIHINGYTKPGRVELWNMIVMHGGVYKQYLEGKTDVTHIIASNLTKKKTEEFSKYRIIRPEWIIDSVEAGKALPWTDPRYKVIDAGQNQKTLQLNKDEGFSVGYEPITSSYKRVTNIGHPNIDEGESLEAQGPVGVSSTTSKPERVSAGGDTPSLNQKTEPAERSTAIVKDPPIAVQDIPSTHIPTSAARFETPVEPQSRPATKTAKDLDFIQDYFRNSRLHHLSAWKANLRMKIDNLSKAIHPWTNHQPPPQKYVMHVDFDCFFAAVSSRGRSDLVGKACAVTHGGNNSGEIASCNYEARKYGIKNGMWMKEAVKLHSDIVSLPYDFEAYEAASEVFYDVLLSLSACAVEAVSIDEALVNITNLVTGTEDNEIEKSCMEIATQVRNRIRLGTGVEVSIGIGANVLQAKLAIKIAKPAGQFFMHPNLLREKLDTFTVDSIPGVGYSTATKLKEHFGITQIQELLDVQENRLQEVFGPKTGIALYQAARGMDDTVVGDIVQRKLVSIEINWGIRLDTPEEVSDYMRRVAEELTKKLLAVGFASAQHLLVKVMRRAKDAPIDPPKFLGHGPCDKFNAGREIPDTGDASVVWKHSLALLESLNIPPNELRGIGVALTRLKPIGCVAQRSVTKFFEKAAKVEDTVRKTVQFEVVEPKTPTKNIGQYTPGTQFVIPSQIDSSVLAELPTPIRNKISAARRTDPVTNSTVYDIPSISQIDPADLAALPPSLRHEILMAKRPVTRTPTKNRYESMNRYIIKSPSPRKAKTDQGKREEKLLPKNLSKSFAKVTRQTPLISASPSEDIDREVLANLPEDIRKEVLLADRNKKIQEARRKQRDRMTIILPVEHHAHEEKVKRQVDLPLAQVLHASDLASSSIDDLRGYLENWLNSEVDGPDEDDLEDFRGYLDVLARADHDFERIDDLLCHFWRVAQKNHNIPWTQAVSSLVQSINLALSSSGYPVLAIA